MYGVHINVTIGSWLLNVENWELNLRLACMAYPIETSHWLCALLRRPAAATGVTAGETQRCEVSRHCLVSRQCLETVISLSWSWSRMKA